MNHFIYILYAGLFSALKEALKGVRSLCLNSGNNVSIYIENFIIATHVAYITRPSYWGLIGLPTARYSS